LRYIQEPKRGYKIKSSPTLILPLPEGGGGYRWGRVQIFFLFSYGKK